MGNWSNEECTTCYPPGVLLIPLQLLRDWWVLAFGGGSLSVVDWFVVHIEPVSLCPAADYAVLLVLSRVMQVRCAV